MKKIGSLLLAIVLIAIGVGGGLYLSGYSPEDWQEPTGSPVLLKGASFGSPPSRTPETQPVFITYQDKSGQSFTANAFPGEVWVVVAQRTSAEKVESLITSNGGTLYGAIPSVGFYWASVSAGGEADFIAALNRSTLVLKATPNEVASLSQGGGLPPDVTDFKDWVNKFAWEPGIPLPIDNANLLVFDGFRKPLGTSGACSTVTHGDAVAGIAGEDGVLVKKFNITTVTGEVDLSLAPWAIISAGMAAEQQDRKLVLNFSVEHGPGDFVDRHACTKGSTQKECNYYVDYSVNATGEVREWYYEDMEQSQRNFLEKIAMVLDAMRTIVPSQFDRIAVVLSAGNSGLELTDEIAYLKRNYPEAFKHMFIVGGTDSEGARWEDVNSSNNQDDMLYAPAQNVEAPPESGCRASGTSAAAPKVSNTLTQLAADKSLGDLTMGQLIDSMFDAAPPMFVKKHPTAIYRNVPEFVGARDRALALVKEKQTTTTTTMTTTPSGLAGEWVSGVAGKGIVWTEESQFATCKYAGDVELKLTQKGNVLTGSARWVSRKLEEGDSMLCPVAPLAREIGTGEIPWEAIRSGTVSASNVTFEVLGFTWEGTFTTDRINGRIYGGRIIPKKGSFDLKRK